MSDHFPTPLFLFLIGITILVLRKFLGGGSGLLSQSPRFGYRITPDGFWITGPRSLTGRQVQYICTVDGNEVRDSVVFTPGPEGHFVFTGGKPVMLALRPTFSSSSSSDWSDDNPSSSNTNANYRDGAVMSGIENQMNDNTPSYPQAY